MLTEPVVQAEDSPVEDDIDDVLSGTRARRGAGWLSAFSAATA